MPDRSALKDLARLVGRSPLSQPRDAAGRDPVLALAERLAPRPRRSVGDMLAAVLALSARSRRAIQPRAHVAVDVFAPSGRRAVELTIARRD